MSKILLVGLVLAFMNVPGLAQAQVASAVDSADLAAVAAYRATIAKLTTDMSAVKAEIRKKNSALALALGKTGKEYDPQEVTAAHQELMTAEQNLAAVELEEYLINKKYKPDWKPDTGGKPVNVNERASGPRKVKPVAP